ncbi:MAG: hypothetical protein ABSA68_04685 [Xanthobacteraceae bacterium]|jgi:hypothetical protein
MPLVWIPILVQLGATVTNDDLAFFGGALATLGVWQLVATGRGLWLACALIGMVAAAWAKLTGLLLTAAMVGAALMYLQWRGRMRLSWMMVAGAVLVLAAAPYIIFVWQYGSPTPGMPAQIALLQDGARAAGWTDLPRKSFPLYLASFIVAFIADWMPVLGRAVRPITPCSQFPRRRSFARWPAPRCRCAGFGCGGKRHAMSYICDLFP